MKNLAVKENSPAVLKKWKCITLKIGKHEIGIATDGDIIRIRSVPFVPIEQKLTDCLNGSEATVELKIEEILRQCND